MKELNNTSFADAINVSKPVVVDFWAAWCMPCKVFAPVFEELSSELGDIADFGKVNIDENNDLASKYGITSIPTLVVFKDGEEVDRLIGVNPKDVVANLVRKHA